MQKVHETPSQLLKAGQGGMHLSSQPYERSKLKNKG
jgi:hypothetical protein